MIHLSRWKVVLLVLSLLFGLLFSYPNLLTADQRARQISVGQQADELLTAVARDQV